MLIAIEGGDGSGKDTQVDLLKKAFSEENFIFTREPGGTAIGDEIRQLLLKDSSVGMSPQAELLLFIASRAQKVKEIIEPQLASGGHVISNRFSLSTAAYQIYGRERLDLLPLYENTTKAALGGCEPDLYILLDIDPELGAQRTDQRKGSNDRIEKEDLEFRKRVRFGYLAEIKKTKKYEIIDATGSIEDIHKNIKDLINKFLKI